MAILVFIGGGETLMNIEFDYRAAVAVRGRELERDATKLLRKKGFTPVGLPKSRQSEPSQHAFERLLIRTPTGGRQGWRR